MGRTEGLHPPRAHFAKVDLRSFLRKGRCENASIRRKDSLAAVDFGSPPCKGPGRVLNSSWHEHSHLIESRAESALEEFPDRERRP